MHAEVLLMRDPSLRVNAEAALKEEWITKQIDMRLGKIWGGWGGGAEGPAPEPVLQYFVD